MPRKSESPVITRFLMQFMFVNWRNDKPTEAGSKEGYDYVIDEGEESNQKDFLDERNSVPTSPKRTQYNAANIGMGIDANTAPNFPVWIRYHIYRKQFNKSQIVN